MKTNQEIRSEAAKVLSGGWSSRVLASGAVLYGISSLVGCLILSAYRDMGLQTWADFLGAKLQHAQQGLGYTVPSDAMFWHMTGASLFQQFMMYVFGAIFAFGMARLLLKAAKNDAKGWFSASFGGFARPLELTWLLVLMNLRVFLWSLLLVFPGVVAVYRYRQAWYLKSDHADWGACKCLAESGRMMRGYKWQAFCLDVFYGAQLALLWLAIAAAGTVAAGGDKFGLPRIVAAVAFAVAAAFAWAAIVVLIRFFAARAVFYGALQPAAADVGDGVDGGVGI
ncbi:MAG: hypothetical protein IKF72_06405 [Kiritimatiellae bacterium]|nr:hypothetical protein [Kiritimatiellia bacterium]